jgi:hypothetical protein
VRAVARHVSCAGTASSHRRCVGRFIFCSAGAFAERSTGRGSLRRPHRVARRERGQTT